MVQFSLVQPVRKLSLFCTKLSHSYFTALGNLELKLRFIRAAEVLCRQSSRVFSLFPSGFILLEY